MAHLEKGTRFGEDMRGFSDRATDIQPTGVRKMFDMAGDDVISVSYTHLTLPTNREV